jgi:predicted Fe-S protein YdhL (DUF1289 family)
MNQNEDHVQSPCKENCCLNDEKTCQGCFRTIVEIAQWPQMDDMMRLDDLRKSEIRKKAYDSKRFK